MLTNDTPYLALTGELWDVFCELYREKWLRYIESALYWFWNGAQIPWTALLPINSLWPSDAIWQHWTWSTLAQVMACCLMAPSHYLNLSSVRSSHILLGIISQKISRPLITEISLKITCLNFNSNLPGANELIFQSILSLLVAFNH